MATFRKLTSSHPINKDVGLLVIRLAVGLSMMVFHGYGKITGGTELWSGIGANMGNLGITFLPAMWGFMAAFGEFVGSILLILGVLFRPAAAMLAFTMFVGALMHLNLPEGEPGAGWNAASHALELLFVYVGLLLAGPGRFAFSLMTRKQKA